MTDPFSRTKLLLGDEAMKILASSSVAVFGVGGVGSYVAEALARSGVGSITLSSSARRRVHCAGSTSISNTEYCTRWPKFRHAFATRRRRRAPSATVVCTS